MGKKKKKVVKPWCWYCDREFDDDKTLILHQKAKHFKCQACGKRLNSTVGMAVHMEQVHKEVINKVPNAIEGRDKFDVEVFGMDGIPEADLIAHEQKILFGIEASGNVAPVQGSGVPVGAMPPQMMPPPMPFMPGMPQMMPPFPIPPVPMIGPGGMMPPAGFPPGMIPPGPPAFIPPPPPVGVVPPFSGPLPVPTQVPAVVSNHSNGNSDTSVNLPQKRSLSPVAPSGNAVVEEQSEENVPATVTKETKKEEEKKETKPFKLICQNLDLSLEESRSRLDKYKQYRKVSQGV